MEGEAEKQEGDGRRTGGGSVEREGKRGRARMRVSISSLLFPPSCRPLSSVQLAKQQVLPAAKDKL